MEVIFKRFNGNRPLEIRQKKIIIKYLYLYYIYVLYVI
jgi:hypothetical protein